MDFKKILYLLVAVALLSPGTADAQRRRAAKKATPAELTAQAREAFFAYNPELASEKIAELRKLKKGVDADSLAMLEQKVERMDEMIQRVEDIVIVDSLTVGRDDFFRHYRLAPTAGILASPAEFGTELGASDSTVVYMPEDGSLMIWGTDKGLVQSRRLTDGSWESPLPLGENLNYGGTANFPFMLTDGVTLYYATDGEDSLGGLDIYMSRSQRDEFAMPQNMGMPYNSPFDDYMMAIDEEIGAGWFATDRNQLGELITIYVFIPNQIRRNLDVDSPDLAERARISSVGATHADGGAEAAAAMLRKIEAIAPDSHQMADESDFEFTLPDGRVYTRWDEFRSPQARRLMEAYVDALAEADADAVQLDRLRGAYKPNDSDTARKILQLEKKQKGTRLTLKKLANQVVSAEMQ